MGSPRPGNSKLPTSQEYPRPLLRRKLRVFPQIDDTPVRVCMSRQWPDLHMCRGPLTEGLEQRVKVQSQSVLPVSGVTSRIGKEVIDDRPGNVGALPSSGIHVDSDVSTKS